MKTLRILIALLSLGMSFHEISQAQKKIKVVTTLNYLKYVVQQVGGERVEVFALANSKQDPHYVTATPRMNQLATDAALFVENGLTLDPWAKNVVDASGNPGIQPGSAGHLVATINVPVKELPLEVSRAWGDIHPQGNPHVWLDPFNVKIIAENIAQRLNKLDGANAIYYSDRLEVFKERLDVAMFGAELMKTLGKKGGDILTRRVKNGELDEWLKARSMDTKLGGWMKDASKIKGTRIVSYHKTYVYFCDRFGIQVAGELEEKPGIPPPPQHRDAMVELVKRENISMILNDNFYSPDAAEYISSKTSAKVVVTYIEVGAAPEVDTYEKLITYLVDKISEPVR